MRGYFFEKLKKLWVVYFLFSLEGNNICDCEFDNYLLIYFDNNNNYYYTICSINSSLILITLTLYFLSGILVIFSYFISLINEALKLKIKKNLTNLIYINYFNKNL